MTTSVPRTIPSLIRWGSEQFPTNPAIVDQGTTLTYRELHDQIKQAAGAFVALGVKHGDRVAIWAPNQTEFVVAMLAAESVGAAFVPLNTRYKGGEATTILERSRTEVLVVANGFLGADYIGMLRGVQARAGDAHSGPIAALPHLREIVDLSGTSPAAENIRSWDDFLALSARIDPAEVDARWDAVTPEDICDIMFTSGTTGVPKGVLTAHRQTIGVGDVWAKGAGLSTADRYAIVNPFFHGFGYKAGLIACLTRGSTIYPVAMFNTTSLLRLIEESRITVLPGAPTIFTSLMDDPQLDTFDISSLRFAIAGAASVPESLFERMLSVLGFEQVAQAYGLTECIVATQSRPNEDPAHVAETTGPAVPGIEISVVDPSGTPVAMGSDGEILLRGDTVMLGYFEDEEATRAAIDTDGWFHTGDIGRLDEHGCLKITDRIKDMFIVGGFNVYPAEVENILSSHPDVLESAVVGVPDERMGTVGKAYITLRRGATLTEEEIVAFCRERLANFKIPRHVTFLEEFPRNASGKILKKDLRETPATV